MMTLKNYLIATLITLCSLATLASAHCGTCGTGESSSKKVTKSKATVSTCDVRDSSKKYTNKDAKDLTSFENKVCKYNYEYNVTGMTCEKCVTKIKNKLQKFDQIKGVSVNVQTGKLYIKSNKRVSKRAVVKRLKKAGYTAKIQK